MLDPIAGARSVRTERPSAGRRWTSVSDDGAFEAERARKSGPSRLGIRLAIGFEGSMTLSTGVQWLHIVH